MTTKPFRNCQVRTVSGHIVNIVDNIDYVQYWSKRDIGVIIGIMKQQHYRSPPKYNIETWSGDGKYLNEAVSGFDLDLNTVTLPCDEPGHCPMCGHSGGQHAHLGRHFHTECLPVWEAEAFPAQVGGTHPE